MCVDIQQVHLSYDAERPILSGVSLALDPGDFYVLTGASGSGKTSLLRLMHGSERPSAGRVLLFGKDTASLSRDGLAALRRRIGFVFQDFRLIPYMTALENAALPLRLAGGTDKEVRSHVRELLAWAGLKDRMNALPRELSGGEQQRVAIARAIVNKPALVLADEPTGNLDSGTAARLLHLFSELNAMNIAVVLATHQNEVAERLGRPVLRLSGGQFDEAQQPPRPSAAAA